MKLLVLFPAIINIFLFLIAIASTLICIFTTSPVLRGKFRRMAKACGLGIILGLIAVAFALKGGRVLIVMIPFILICIVDALLLVDCIREIMVVSQMASLNYELKEKRRKELWDKVFK